MGAALNGAVNLRELTQAEIDTRNDGVFSTLAAAGTPALTNWALPQRVLSDFFYIPYAAASAGVLVPTPAETGIQGYDDGQANPYVTQLANVGQALPPNHGFLVYELTFQDQAHDAPIAVTDTTAGCGFWYRKLGPLGATTPTFINGPFTVPAVACIAGDYAGVQGSAQYNASIAISSAGSMVSAYTSQPLETSGTPPVVNGTTVGANIYAERLAESSDTAGPNVVGLTDGNGVDLLKGGTATGVNAAYFVPELAHSGGGLFH